MMILLNTYIKKMNNINYQFYLIKIKKLSPLSKQNKINSNLKKY